MSTIKRRGAGSQWRLSTGLPVSKISSILYLVSMGRYGGAGFRGGSPEAAAVALPLGGSFQGTPFLTWLPWGGKEKYD
jgi:hypothetical protein